MLYSIDSILKTHVVDEDDNLVEVCQTQEEAEHWASVLNRYQINPLETETIQSIVDGETRDAEGAYRIQFIDCTPEMIALAIECKKNFARLPHQKNATLTGVGFNSEGEKCIEFVEYTEDGVTHQSYHGNLKDYDNRVFNSD